VTPLPDVDYAVVLRGQSGGSFRARVDGLQPPDIVLERIGDLGREPTAQVGSRMLLTWPDENGLVCLPVLLVDAPVGDPARWAVEVVGDAWREQRRHWPRAAIEGTCVIHYAVAPEGTDAETATGHLIDASEAGVRCAVERRHYPLLVPGTRVAVELMLGSDIFEVLGQVLYGKVDAREDDRIEVVVVFDRPVPRADEIRGHVERQKNRGRPAQVYPITQPRARSRDGLDR